MSTRANIFIRDNHTDRDKQVIYSHWNGYLEGVGRDLEETLKLFTKSYDIKPHLNKKTLAEFCCQQNPSWENTTPEEAYDAEYIYEVNLEKMRVDWRHLSVKGDLIEEEFLCYFGN